jgi:ribosomal protein L16 Arg81 hydroxylase
MRIPGLMFEVAVDVGLGGGGEVVAPVAAEPVAPAAEPVAPVAPEPAPAASFDYDDPRLQDLIQTQAATIAQQQLEQYVQRAQAQQPQTQQGFDVSQLLDEYGNVNPAALATMMEHNRQSTLEAVQQMFTPLASQMQAQQEAEVVASGEARLEDILADDISRNGDFVRAAGNEPEQVAAAQQADAQARQMVRTMADQMFPEIAQRYGPTPRAAEIAMTRAADQVRGLLRAVGSSAQAVQANQLATLAGQNGEVGGTGVGAVSRPVVKIGERVTDRYAAAGPPIQ